MTSFTTVINWLLHIYNDLTSSYIYIYIDLTSFTYIIIWRLHNYNYLTSFTITTIIIWRLLLLQLFDVFYYCNYLTSFFYYNYWRFHQYYYLTSFISTMIWRLSLLQMVRPSYKETDRTQKSYSFYKLINGIVALTPKKRMKWVSCIFIFTWKLIKSERHR